MVIVAESAVKFDFVGYVRSLIFAEASHTEKWFGLERFVMD